MLFTIIEGGLGYPWKMEGEVRVDKKLYEFQLAREAKKDPSIQHNYPSISSLDEFYLVKEFAGPIFPERAML